MSGVNGEVGRSVVDGRFVSIGSKSKTARVVSRETKLRHVLVAYFALLDISHLLPVTRDEVCIYNV